ncbi:MAG: pantetheine-phosphate adenylyltransferase [Thermofilaceae archaeon]|nr:pantetheine-phosphate adenylyltransferase [Thermofilaceae archaeon]
MREYKYRKVALGGTFSFFHVGHRHLLKYALSLGENVVIGVVSDEFASKSSKHHPIEPYEIRALRVLRYCLRKAKQGQRIKVTALDDVEGPAATDPLIEAIVATEETALNAIKLSINRVKRGLPSTNVEVVEPILDENHLPISSSKLWIRYFGSIFSIEP